MEGGVDRHVWAEFGGIRGLRFLCVFLVVSAWVLGLKTQLFRV